MRRKKTGKFKKIHGSDGLIRTVWIQKFDSSDTLRRRRKRIRELWHKKHDRPAYQREKTPIEQLLYDFRFNSTDKTSQEKISLLLEYSNKILCATSGSNLDLMREEFRQSRTRLQEMCFVCDKKADVRHHVICLKNGGRNVRDNIVSLCRGCHKKIHDWL